MAHPTKIATCCYCGTRAALVLTGRDRHELSCSGCGAPLHDLKMLKVDRKGDREPLQTRSGAGYKTPKPKKKSHKKKKSKPRFGKLLGEAFDIIDDIFD